MNRKLYLASDSKARKKLLNILGLKFKVLPSKIDEHSIAKNSNFSKLVQRNAYAKAKAVSQKVSSGIIIGADTIVVTDKKVFGKPQSIDDAVAMLKNISGKAQMVYTGIAVIDKDYKKELVSFEKTKIHMDKLTDEQIRGYFKIVNPLDKAGSFDIQGMGALFISRIEGCFYNVVGLPLRKLYLMLKQMGINIFVQLFFIGVAVSFLGGCSTEYNIVTGEQESYYYSTEKEVNIGENIARQVEKEYKLVEDPLVAQRVETIGKKIAAVCDRKDIFYHFKVIEDKDVNAVSLPGGYVYVFKGLVEKVSNDDELAVVIAHEIGHIVARHSVKKMQAMNSYTLLRLLAIPVPQAGEVVAASDAVFVELLLGYGREDELLADQLGTRYAKLAGFDPHAMISFLEKLHEVDMRKPATAKNYFKTHPYVPDRIRVVKQELGEAMGFKDYINIEQNTHEYNAIKK